MSLIKNIMPESAESKIRRIGDWSNAGQGDFEGQVLEWTNASDQKALFKWNEANSYWMLESTGAEWFLIEDWSSGTIRPELWTIADNTASYAVNGGANRIEVSFTTNASSSPEELELELVPKLSRSAEMKVRADLNTPSTPTTSAYNIRSIVYFNAWNDDAIQSALEQNTTDYQWSLFERPVGGGSTTVDNNTTITEGVYDLVSGSYELQEVQTRFEGSIYEASAETDSSISGGTGFLHTINANPATGYVFSGSGADVNQTVYIQQVWIRR